MKEDVFVQYKSMEERMAAFRRMIAMRQEWEAHVREIIAKRNAAQAQGSSYA